MVTEEIKRLENVDMINFAKNVELAAPESFKNNEEAIKHTRKVFRITEELLDSDKVEGQIRDIILIGVLVSDLAIGEVPETAHPYMIQSILEDLKDDLHQALWDGIMRIAESHEGTNTTIKQLQPKPGTPEHLVALANVLARSENIQVYL